MVINAKYTPFSFKERIAPLSMYKEEYDKTYDTLSALASGANTYSQYLDPESEEGKTVQAFNNTMHDVAQSLAHDGLKSINRSTLLNLRNIYNSEIAPINNAAKALGTLRSTVSKIKAQKPNILMGNMPTISDLMADPDAMPYMVDGKDLLAEGLSIGNSVSPSEEEAVDFFNGNIDAIPGVSEAIERAMETNGANQLANPSQAQDLIIRGIRNGVFNKLNAQRMADYKSQLKIQERLNNKSSKGSGDGSTLHGDGTAREIVPGRLTYGGYNSTLHESSGGMEEGKVVDVREYKRNGKAGDVKPYQVTNKTSISFAELLEKQPNYARTLLNEARLGFENEWTDEQLIPIINSMYSFYEYQGAPYDSTTKSVDRGKDNSKVRIIGYNYIPKTGSPTGAAKEVTPPKKDRVRSAADAAAQRVTPQTQTKSGSLSSKYNLN